MTDGFFSQKDATELFDDVAALHSQNRILKEEIRKLIIYIDTFKKSSEAVLGGFIEQRQKLVNELSSAMEQVAAYKEKVAKLTADNDLLRVENTELTQQIAIDDSLVGEKNAQIETLTHERDEYKEALIDLSRHNDGFFLFQKATTKTAIDKALGD